MLVFMWQILGICHISKVARVGDEQHLIKVLATIVTTKTAQNKNMTNRNILKILKLKSKKR